ncbi:hypothetical protein F53441_1789 [Fusarium austroafricanum]|uniref:Chitin-binding type-4 domain-containing protein n=1 Tax=Fusarium austroafricanum TaxID=2364996 RepID=A0A8H4KUP4_9HYPO|nr:hypothetical protein F53441_1789 [Fusarium austroafricanum]
MKTAAALVSLLPLVAAHGFVKSPTPRKPGNAYKAACGDQPFYQQEADINGNVQGIKQVVGSNFDAKKCNLWLCKGFQFDDNKANVQSYSLGDKIDFEVTIAAPHTGYANVSVVKTSSDKMIGEPLIEFENYAANAGLNKNNTAFSVTLPKSLDGECTKAGDCVLQWFWDAPDINQTYESCVDFVVGGSGSGSKPAPEKPATSAAPVATSAAAEKPVPTTLQAVTVSSAAPVTTAAPDAGSDDEDCDDEPKTGSDDEDCDDETETGAEKPVPTTLKAVAISSAAPETTAAPGTGSDEDCDDEPKTGSDDEDCDDEEDNGADDEECPADEYDTPSQTSSPKKEEPQGISAAANTAAETKPKSSPKPKPVYSDKTGSSPKANNAGSNTVTSYVTVAAETHYVTVTADAPACTA